MTITGFFTDSTLCIGCKACEVKGPRFVARGMTFTTETQRAQRLRGEVRV